MVQMQQLIAPRGIYLCNMARWFVRVRSTIAVGTNSGAKFYAIYNMSTIYNLMKMFVWVDLAFYVQYQKAQNFVQYYEELTSSPYNNVHTMKSSKGTNVLPYKEINNMSLASNYFLRLVLLAGSLPLLAGFYNAGDLVKLLIYDTYG